jgi:hypothetical protein
LVSPDSTEPINNAVTPSSNSSIIHPFFRGGSAPRATAVVAGARRSGRATRPSNRITDPDNAEAPAHGTTHKRKASSGLPAARRINPKVADDDIEVTDGSEISDYMPKVAEAAEQPPASSDFEAGDTEPDDDIGYELTKAMGDADHDVSPFSSL